jgi:NAD(P)-dependent dehydrogenase (short-subunit alcohol dehydrogenase family)
MRCDLGGKVAIVTGAAGTIGRGIVNRLTANGASVAIADINFEGAKALAAELPGSIGCRVDITSLDSTEAGGGRGDGALRARRHPRQQRRHQLA